MTGIIMTCGSKILLHIADTMLCTECIYNIQGNIYNLGSLSTLLGKFICMWTASHGYLKLPAAYFSSNLPAGEKSAASQPDMWTFSASYNFLKLPAGRWYFLLAS